MKRRHFLQSSIAAAAVVSLPASRAVAAAIATMSEVAGGISVL